MYTATASAAKLTVLALANTIFGKPDPRCPSLVHFVNAPSGIHNVSVNCEKENQKVTQNWQIKC